MLQIAKFIAKATTFNDNLNLLKKIKTKPKSCQRPEKPRPKKHKSSTVKCGGFAHSFPQLRWLNAQNFEKTNHGFPDNASAHKSIIVREF